MPEFWICGINVIRILLLENYSKNVTVYLEIMFLVI